MKGLFVRWEVDLMDIPWGLMELGEEVELYPAFVQMQVPRKEEEAVLSNYLKENNYSFVITHNFSQTVSNACMENKVKYVSWVFDSPQIHLYSQAAFNDCNYIFVFDKNQYERMKSRGLSHLFYLPLAANVSKISMLPISEEDEKILERRSRILFKRDKGIHRFHYFKESNALGERKGIFWKFDRSRSRRAPNLCETFQRI